jgi:hypothetical protein
MFLPCAIFSKFFWIYSFDIRSTATGVLWNHTSVWHDRSSYRKGYFNAFSLQLITSLSSRGVATLSNKGS